MTRRDPMMSNAALMVMLIAVVCMIVILMSACGSDPDGPAQLQGQTWINTVDPKTGTQLACFVVDLYNAAGMHCVEVTP